MTPVVVLWCLVIVFASAFAWQVARRVRLIASAPNTFSIDRPADRIVRWIGDVLLQRKTIAERPLVGIGHALVFWGFVAFAGYTATEILAGLAVADFTHATWFHAYTLVLTPFAIGALCGILGLLVRRAVIRPIALGERVSAESIAIGLFIVVLMVTFLLAARLQEGSTAASVNWWIHAIVVLVFLALIPTSKHLHLLASPITVFLRSMELGQVPNLDFEKEEVGLETIQHLGSKTVLDALTCVECGRCQVNCPAWGSGKTLNPKAIILDTQRALLVGARDRKLVDVYGDSALWQCTTCGACENQCPVGIEHLPLVIGARRGLVSNGDAPAYLGAVYNHLERRRNVWGLSYEQRQKFISSVGLETYERTKHEWLLWLGCAGAFESDYQKGLRSLCDILRARGVTVGVLEKEQCTGDVAKRSGNEYLFQELAAQNIEMLTAAGARKILTSCPHCLKTLGGDYRAFGFEAEVVHSTVVVASLPHALMPVGAGRESVTFHDPCYLGRYAGVVDQPRELLARVGAEVSEPVRHRVNPFCCGAGGGLLFRDTEEEGRRIADVRFEQLRSTGARTVVTACPFCTIMLKGAQTFASGETTVVDVMTFVSDRISRSAG